MIIVCRYANDASILLLFDKSEDEEIYYLFMQGQYLDYVNFIKYGSLKMESR